MNRNKSLGNSKKNKTSNNQIQGRDRINQEISRFNDFDRFFNDFDDFDREHQDFFGGFGQMNRFDDLSNMSSMRNVMNFESNNSSNFPGTFISKSYVSSVKYDGTGRPHQEVYQSQSIKQTDKNGKKIQESQKAYQNSSTGVQKAAHERVLNDKGHKYVKERNVNTGDDMEHNIYKGINEEDLPQFNNEYGDYKQKSNFDRNYQMLGNGNRNYLGANNINENQRNKRVDMNIKALQK